MGKNRTNGSGQAAGKRSRWLSGASFASLGPVGRTIGFVSALASGTAVAQDSAPVAQQGSGTAVAQQGNGTAVAQQSGGTAGTAVAQQGGGTAVAQNPSASPVSASASHTPAPLVLPTVEVEGKADSYRTGTSQMPRATKALVDTPQTVTVVPEQVMEEQKATTVRDALRNVSGITVSAGEGGRQGDSFVLRGFSAQNDLFRDGSRDMGWYTRDTFNLEGVEVFFGPSSVLFGRGSTGGAVNLVTKSPKKTSFADVGFTGATAPHGRLEADVNHAFSGAAQVRLNAMGQRGEVAGREGVEENRTALAPSARFELGQHTVLGLDYLYQRERSVPDYGQPFFNGKPVSLSLDVPRTAFYGVEGSDREHVDAHIATARVQHDFTPAVRLTNAFRFGVVNRLAVPTAPRNLAPVEAPTAIGRQRFETSTDNLNFVDQTDLRLEGPTGPFRHVANIGVELARESRKQTRHNFQVAGAMGTATNINADLRRPDPSPDVSSLDRVYASSNESAMLTAGVYVSDQISLTPWLEVLGSLRLDAFDTEYEATNAMGMVTPLDRNDLLLNWRGGLVVHPLEKTSVYVTVGSSANPSAEAGTLSDATASLEPEKNFIHEIGAKADLLEDRLHLGGSAFRITKSNARVPGADPTLQPQVLAGRQRVQGFNLGAAGTVVGDLKLIGSYTFLHSRIVKHTNPFLVGQEMPNTPAHSLALWSTYTLLSRLTFGGGATYQAETAVNNPANAMTLVNEVPSFWRLDAFASYAFSKAEVQLNVANLTDALYYEQYSGSQAVPAEGRVAMLSARMRL